MGNNYSQVLLLGGIFMVDITVLNNMEYADAENFVHNNGYINTIGALK